MINPLEAAGAFGSMMVGIPANLQKVYAKRATLYAACIFIGFGIGGYALLHALGISIAAFEIAGGVLLLRVGFGMVFAQPDPEPEKAQARTDPSIFPLAIPIISGPGALTAAVTTFGKHDSPLGYVEVTLIAIVVFAITYVAMRGATWLTRVLGAGGVEALGRLVGIIVAAIAVQFVVDGVSELSGGLLHTS
jgi:multiple antibiotic resistance protein